MLTLIRLINWRSHKDSTLNFKKGTNILIGAMGSGKSSVLDAISFALFGTFPALERRRLKLVDMVKISEDFAEIALEFIWSNEKYRIVRRINRKKEVASTEAKVFRAGKLVDDGTEAVNAYTENLLGVNYDLFTRAIYSEQNNIDYFLSIDPKKRKEEIDRLLGLDRFETVRANTTSLINRIRSERKGLEQKFNREYLEELVAKKDDVTKRANLARTEIDALAEMIECGNSAIKAKDNALQLLTTKKETYERLSQEKLKLQTIAEGLEKETHGKQLSSDDVNNIRAKRDGINKEKNEKQGKLADINSSLASLSSRHGALQTKKKMATATKLEIEKNEKKLLELLNGKRVDEIRIEIQQKENELLAMLSEKRMLEKIVGEMEKVVDTVSPKADACPFCGTPLTQHKIDELLEEKKQKMREMKDRLDGLKATISTNEKTLGAAKSRLSEMDAVRTRLETLKTNYIDPTSIENEAATVANGLTNAQNNRAALQKTMDELAEKNEQVSILLQEYEQLARKKTELEKAVDSIQKISKSLDELSFDPKVLESSRNEFEKLKIEHEKKIADRRTKEVQLHALLEMSSVLGKDVSNQLGIESSISNMTRAEEETNAYRNIVLETQLGLRNELVDGINAAMAEIWSIFYPHKNYKEIRLCITEKDYELQVFDSQWRMLESIASGGERACAALTLRVALAMVLTPKLSWLILDEPTHNLDKEAVELLSNTLQYKVPEVVQQTFVITHDEALAGSEFASSYRLARDKETNGPTRVEVM